MKEIKEEIIKKEYKITYEALDGVMFNSSEECYKYEQSAKMVLYAKYKPLVLATLTEDELYGIGSEEYTIDTVKLEKESDIDTILQLYSLYRGNRYSEEEMANTREKVKSYFTNSDIIFIGRGCSYDDYDSFYIMGSLSSIIANITEKANGNSEC